MTKHNRTAAFFGYEEVRLYKSDDYHRYDLYIDAHEDIDFTCHDNLYIPPPINKADFILLLIYDFELTCYELLRPTKVIYTDFYFRALNEGIGDF